MSLLCLQVMSWGNYDAERMHCYSSVGETHLFIRSNDTVRKKGHISQTQTCEASLFVPTVLAGLRHSPKALSLSYTHTQT